MTQLLSDAECRLSQQMVTMLSNEGLQGPVLQEKQPEVGTEDEQDRPLEPMRSPSISRMRSVLLVAVLACSTFLNV